MLENNIKSTRIHTESCLTKFGSPNPPNAAKSRVKSSLRGGNIELVRRNGVKFGEGPGTSI